MPTLGFIRVRTTFHSLDEGLNLYFYTQPVPVTIVLINLKGGNKTCC